MPRGGQIYRVITKDFEQIKNELQKIQNNDKKKFPCMIDFNHSKEKLITGTLSVKYIHNSVTRIEEPYFEFDVKHSRCYIIGTNTGRDMVINEFNRQLEFDDNTKVIQNIKLNGRSIYVDMLKILTDIDGDHFIKTLKATFGLSGHKSPLSKHNVKEIKYGFIKNLCVSKDKESKNYADHARDCTIKFGVWKLGNFDRKKSQNKKQLAPLPIEVTTDYTFRFFYDYEVNDILSVMKKLTVDPNNYSVNT